MHRVGTEKKVRVLAFKRSRPFYVTLYKTDADSYSAVKRHETDPETGDLSCFLRLLYGGPNSVLRNRVASRARESERPGRELRGRRGVVLRRESRER